MLNTETLEQLKQDVGKDLMITLVNIFIKETDLALNSYSSSNPSEQQRISHSLKSSALSYGVDEVGLVSKQLEQLLKVDNIDEATSVFNVLTTTWTEHKKLLQNYIV